LKRTSFRVPEKMPVPVRALWKSASPEEQARAHRCASVLLRAWLGKITREEGAAELDLTPLRFWQLSQQAVAGMVAGLLRQPRFRGRASTTEMGEGSPAEARRRIATLERELQGAQRLIALLKDLPAHRASAPPKVEGTRRGARRTERRSKKARPDERAARAPGADAGGDAAT
jgi:hypothetical protein